MSSVDRLCEQLKAQGRRLTPQRRAIIQALFDDDSHPTAEQIFTHVRQDMPDISHGTVYNTLHELVEMDVLRELDLGLGERHYDFADNNHAHLICLGCGRVEDVPYARETVTLPAKHNHGFQVVDCNVIFRGYCPDCLSTEN
jgi:Fur family peroxide stress response transcriptional regulator